MRDGHGNQLSPEEQEKVKSIQGAPDGQSLKKVSINPEADKDPDSADKPEVDAGDKPAAGVGR